MMRNSPEPVAPASDVRSYRLWLAVLCCAWLGLGVLLVFQGPILNSHEAIVAQIARQTLQTGEWIVPYYLEVPFLVKPPLNPWLVAIAGSLLPADTITGLPVSTAAARLPSLLAILLTILVLYSLASSMYGSRAGLATAFIYATCGGVLAFALNATSEALLTFFCAWAYAEFWWSRQVVGRRRMWHQLRFYVALSLGMMTKAPMPLIVVAFPLAVWWWTQRPLLLLAEGGPRRFGDAAMLFGRDLLRQTRLSLTDTGVWWGIPLTAVLLLIWMYAVSLEVPYIWELWKAEYLNRLHDKHIWPASHKFWYYLPALFGFAAPWLLSMPEALAGPFLRRYDDCRKPMMYAWYWVAISTLVLSCMHFKQDYYLVPVLPGCALLLGPVLHHLFLVPSPLPGRLAARGLVALVVVLLIATPVACFFVFRDETVGRKFSHVALAAAAVAFFGGISLAVWFYLRGRKPASFSAVGVAGLAVFASIWIAAGSDAEQLREQTALVEGLKNAGVDEDDKVYWGSSVPDGRITFYANRWIHQIGDPFALRAETDDRDPMSLMLEMGSRICTMLEAEGVYIVFTRERYGLLKSLFRPDMSVLFEVDRGPAGRDKHDWVVVTGKTG